MRRASGSRRSCAARCSGSRAMRAQQRHQQDVGVRQAGRRIARHAEDRPSADLPNAVGLPGLTAMPWKITSPRCRDHVEDQIALADGAAAGKHQHVVPPRLTSIAPSSIVERVRGRAAARRESRRASAMIGAQREAVDVVDLAGRERLSGIDDLVAGREDRDARPGEDLDRQSRRWRRVAPIAARRSAAARRRGPSGPAAMSARAPADVLARIAPA